jgi:hypothetical protein
MQVGHRSTFSVTAGNFSGRSVRWHHNETTGDRRMRFHLHRIFRRGPLYVTLNERGLSGWRCRIGRIGYDLRHRTTFVDTPGPGEWLHRHRRTGR